MGRIARREALSLKAFAVITTLVLCLVCPNETAAYAVLAHEAIIDSVWDTNLRPLLLKRFPAATPEELKEAHGYAYGGAIIQDMGYYPHGSFFFSDLTHYVRQFCQWFRRPQMVRSSQASPPSKGKFFCIFSWRLRLYVGDTACNRVLLNSRPEP